MTTAPTVVHSTLDPPPELSNAPAARRSRLTPTIVALGAWSGLIVVAAVTGAVLLLAGVHMQIDSPPLTGYPRWGGSYRVLPAIAFGMLGVRLLPLAASRLRWLSLLGVVAASTAVWAITLDLFDGWQSLVAPVHTEYAATAARIVSPHQFLTTFPARIRSYNLHTQSHPPAMELILWVINRAGWHGAGAAATLYIAVGSLAGVAALVALRDVAGEQRARAAAPFLVLFPGAIWLATSGDAFFAGVSATAVALLVLATGCRGRPSDLYACTGGLLFGLTAFLSYGLVLLAVVPLVVAWNRRRVRPMVVAAFACGAVFLTFLAAGFSWLAGLQLAHQRYGAGVASRRPYAYFLVADLAALALAVGPAAAIGLAHLRDRATWLLAGSALAVVALADLSGMSKAEVERIWLPFMPWLLLAAASIAYGAVGPLTVRRVRYTLAAQVATALLIQLTIKSPW